MKHNPIKKTKSGVIPKKIDLPLYRVVNIPVSSFKEVISATLSDYLKHSTFHGVKYLLPSCRYYVNRVVWCLAWAVALWATCSKSIDLIDRLQSNPIIVSIAPEPSIVWEIPFPAVTICPMLKTNASIFNYAAVLQQFMDPIHRDALSEKDIDRLQAINHVCQTESPLLANRTIGLQTITQTLLDISPSLNKTLVTCEFANQLKPCFKLFTQMLTEEGICFTFNLISANEMYSTENVHTSSLPDNTLPMFGWRINTGQPHVQSQFHQNYPYRTMSSGSRAGLKIKLNALDQTANFHCRNSVEGYMVILHLNIEVPHFATSVYRLPIADEIVLTVKPVIMDTSNELRSYDPLKRKCYFHDERKLRFFRLYTQQNCEVECLSNLSRALCDCVHFAYPRDEHTAICGTSKFECFEEAEDLMHRQIYSDFISGNQSSCYCLPSCTSLTYDAEVSTASLEQNWTQNSNVKQAILESSLVIFYKEQSFFRTTRKQYLSSIDFLAGFGSLLGLFTGMSLLGIVELVYYWSLRLFWNIRKRKLRQVVRVAEKLPPVQIVRPKGVFEFVH